MFVPLPGLSHLKVLHSSPVPPPPETPEPTDGTARATAAQLTVVALETAFGLRPIQHLHRRRYDVGVRAHCAARQRHTLRQEPVRLETFHLRGTEVFGSALVGGRPHGFTASLEKVGDRWRMRTFRII